MALCCGAAVHVGAGLLKAFTFGAFHAVVQNLAFNDGSLGGLTVGDRPDDEQVGAPLAQTEFTLDAAPTVHDALQLRLQQQLGSTSVSPLATGA